MHNGERNNLSGRPSNPKFMCTDSRISKYMKLKWTELKTETDIIFGVF